MGSVNTQSVREEAERIKAEFERLSASKKINSESKILFQSMLMLINLLIAIFLEKTTKKNTKQPSTKVDGLVLGTGSPTKYRLKPISFQSQSLGSLFLQSDAPNTLQSSLWLAHLR